ncbi:hypothetical protein CDL12_09718 [Handroanthus impetiginosus]|uniref:Trafficking protein particle complex subunit n=1 Tax=Handroanthus impetiginosus TaxID=429701 RepID=A0A2G9HJB0_9LAMI|nr:hypothetical protein CDL12_09718 [Handroanthus impetiginosus]
MGATISLYIYQMWRKFSTLLQVLSGACTKFFAVCEPGTLHMEGLLKHIYELYTDYVLKNPDINLAQAVQKDRVALLGR